MIFLLSLKDVEFLTECLKSLKSFSGKIVDNVDFFFLSILPEVGDGNHYKELDHHFS